MWPGAIFFFLAVCPSVMSCEVGRPQSKALLSPRRGSDTSASYMAGKNPGMPIRPCDVAMRELFPFGYGTRSTLKRGGITTTASLCAINPWHVGWHRRRKGGYQHLVSPFAKRSRPALGGVHLAHTASRRHCWGRVVCVRSDTTCAYT